MPSTTPDLRIAAGRDSSGAEAGVSDRERPVDRRLGGRPAGFLGSAARRSGAAAALGPDRVEGFRLRLARLRAEQEIKRRLLGGIGAPRRRRRPIGPPGRPVGAGPGGPGLSGRGRQRKGHPRHPRYRRPFDPGAPGSTASARSRRTRPRARIRRLAAPARRRAPRSWPGEDRVPRRGRHGRLGPGPGPGRGRRGNWPDGPARACSTACAAGATGRAPARGRSALAIWVSWSTAAARPIRIRPAATAMVPATIIVLPRLNSLIGIPKPIVTMPAAATRYPV